MDEPFELPITYLGRQLMLKSQLIRSDYVYKFKVGVNGIDIIFEPDEERHYRAMVDSTIADKMRQSDIELLKVISEALQSL